MVKYLLFAAIVSSLTAAEKSYTAAEVARHKKPSDCWMIIEDTVYDVTEYVARHRRHDYDIRKHCGSDSSAGWKEKPETGKPHSRKAERLLERYRIGKLIK